MPAARYQVKDAAISYLHKLTHSAKNFVGRTALVGLSIAAIVAGTAIVAPLAAAAETGGYPEWNAQERDISTYTWWVDENTNGAFNNGEQESPRGYDYRNCTDWVAWRMPGLGLGGVPSTLGSGNTWDSRAPAAWIKDASPEPGDIAQSDAGGYGHVGIVEGYTKNTVTGAVTEIVVSEYNKKGDGNFSITSYTPDANGIFWRGPGKKWDNFLDLNGTGRGINNADLTSGNPPSVSEVDPVPAVFQRNGETNMVVVAPDQTLDYHFNPGGGGTWGRLDIPGSDAKSTPAVLVRPSGELNVVAQGVDGSLDFYINPFGSNTWGKIEVAGPNSAYSAPSVIQRPSGETNIVVQGPNNTLDYYYNFQGNPNWYKVTVPNGQAYSKPAVVQRSNGETNIAVLGPNNSMDFYYNAPGSAYWGKVPVAVSGWAFSAPSMVQRPDGETVIAVQGQSHSLDIYINAPGHPAWGRIRAAENNTTYNDANPPIAVLRPSGELNIAVHGSGNSASIYYNAQGSTHWGQSLAAVPGYSFREPVMIQRSTGETNLIIVGPDKRLDYYINDQGSPYWATLPISGNNSTY